MMADSKLTKIKNFCRTITTDKQSQETNWEKILATQIMLRGLMSLIYKELLETNKKKDKKFKKKKVVRDTVNYKGPSDMHEEPQHIAQ